MLSDTVYIDPLNARANEEIEELEDGVEDVKEEEEREKGKRPGKRREVSRKYEVIGTVLDRQVISPCSLMIEYNFD